jgi:hypothetical protein
MLDINLLEKLSDANLEATQLASESSVDVHAYKNQN